MTRIVMMYIGLLAMNICNAQVGSDGTPVGLKVGDHMVQFPKSEIINYPTDIYDGEMLSDKVVILDFFNTGCVSCIENMPRLDSLRRALSDRLDVIMVTSESKSRIENFYRNNRFLKERNCSLPTIVSDSTLKKMFPHQAVSHTVWLYKNKVYAISQPGFVNEENINKLIHGEKLNIPLKDDYRIFENLGEMVNSSNMEDIGRILLTGFKPWLRSSGLKFKYDSLSGGYVSYINNLDVLGAFTSAWAYIKPPKYFLTKERLEWSVQNPARYFYDKASAVPYHVWLEKYAISYIREDNLGHTDSLRAIRVLENLSDFLGVDVDWQMRRKRCLIISRIDPVGSVNNEGGMVYEGTEALALTLDFVGKYAPLVDEANTKTKMVIPKFNSIAELNLILVGYGLEIKEGWRDIEVLVFRER